MNVTSIYVVIRHTPSPSTSGRGGIYPVGKAPERERRDGVLGRRDRAGFEGTGPARHGALAASRDGRLLAVALPDGSARVVDAATGRVRQTLHPVGGIDEHGNGFTWPASLADLEDRACAIAGRSLTRKEWTRYLGDQPYAPACS